MTENVHILGLTELREALVRKIPMEMQGPVLQKALAAGAKPIVAKARAFAPEPVSGTLNRSIYSYRDRAGSKPTFESRFIGVRKAAWYWRLIEFGRGAVTVKKAKVLGTPAEGFFGRTVKAYPPHPFLRPAFEWGKYVALDAMIQELKIAMDAAAQKATWGRAYGAGGAAVRSAISQVRGLLS